MMATSSRVFAVLGLIGEAIVEGVWVAIRTLRPGDVGLAHTDEAVSAYAGTTQQLGGTAKSGGRIG